MVLLDLFLVLDALGIVLGGHAHLLDFLVDLLLSARLDVAGRNALSQRILLRCVVGGFIVGLVLVVFARSNHVARDVDGLSAFLARVALLGGLAIPGVEKICSSTMKDNQTMM